MNNFGAIIWDWNGTLLNDIDLCINSMNVLLKERGLKTLEKGYYKEIFTFPVIEYYKELGFDFRKETFDAPAHEFIDEYHKKFDMAKLHEGALETILFFRRQNITQFILSAMQQEALERTVRKFDIHNNFKELVGINDHFAQSKIQYGEKLIKRCNLDKESTVLIGDSTHDFEVAKELGIQCILIANGHQSRERLMGLNVKLFDNLTDFLNEIKE